jgi:putative DNA primase/helicase
MDIAIRSDTLAVAAGYLARGWCPIPIPLRSKAPILPGWQKLRPTFGDLERFFRGNENIGVTLGEASDWLADIDLDSDETIDLADAFLPTTAAIFGRASKPRSHWLYRSPSAPTRKFIDPVTGGMLVELRSNGGTQTVFPPSVHPTGEPIEWVGEGNPTEVRGTDLVNAVGHLAAAALLVRYHPEGERLKLKLEAASWPNQMGDADPKVRAKLSDGKVWLDLLPLVPPAEEPRPYPINALPPTLRDACIAYQAFGQQPMALIAGSGLAAVSLATQGLADVERAPDLSGPIGLSVLVVAQSGERKTSADKRMSKAIRMWESDKTDEMKPDVDAARARMAAFEAEKDGLLAKIKAAAGRPDGKSGKAKVEVADLDKLKHDLEVMETQAPVAPIVPSLFYEDVTPEKMAEDLGLGWPSASLWSDEAGLVVGGHGMGRDSIMRYLALINRFWDGQPFSRKRSTTKSFTVKGRRLTTCLMMQETVLRQLLAAGDGVSRGSGFMARFLMTWPVSTMGGRFYRPRDPDDTALVRYDTRLRELLDMPLPVDGDGMVLVPPILSLSSNAGETWIELHDEVERELARHGEFFDVKDVAAKTADNAARIAGVFHVLEHGAIGEIAAGTMEDAAELALWHLHEAKRIIGAIEVPEALADAKVLLEWLLAQDGDMTPRDISYRGPNPLRDRERRDRAIEMLAETNHVVRVKVGRKGEALILNPKLEGRP